MQTKFSEDIIPLSDLKVNPGKVVNQVNDTRRPVLLTSRGRGVAVVQGIDEFERTAEELRFIKAVAQGLADVREGNTVTLAEAKKILGVK
jgi:prevent-host-death family protein